MQSMIKLNNGVEIPGVGLGVFRAVDGDETRNAVKWAIEAGYRHIDTATCYRNEKSVGDGIRESGIDRKDIFITTKMWCSEIDDGKFEEAIEFSLKELGTDYIDLYLLHWPRSVEKNIAAYKVMEKYYRAGTLRAIGVSNYKEHHLEELMAETEIVPAVNQVELHPDFDQHELKAFCDARGIKLEAWSPLGGQGSDLMQNKVLVSLAEKHGRTPAQIIIRWNIQRGVIVIPKSVHKERIVSNFNVFDFELSKEDMELIGTLEAGRRYRADPDHFEYTR